MFTKKVVADRLAHIATVKDGYIVGEIYHLRSPNPGDSFVPCNGALIENADTTFPEAWEYLQSDDGKFLCTTEEEWQAMTTAVWHTITDGTGTSRKTGWDGIGGAGYYVVDTEAKTIRMPDLRGMSVTCATGETKPGDSLGWIQWHLIGLARGLPSSNSLSTFTSNRTRWVSGPFYYTQYYDMNPSFVSGSGVSWYYGQIDASRVVPVGDEFIPQSMVVGAYAYLGEKHV